MWRQSRKYVKAVLNLITAVVILLFVVFVVPSVISYFMPFVIGWIIAMIANPLVRFLDEKIKIRRKAGSAIVIIAVIAAIVAGIYGILSLLAGQLKGFVEELPGLWKAMESDISNAGSSLESFSHYFSPNVQEQVAKILNSLMNLLSSAVDHMGSPTVSAVGNFAKNIPTIIVGVIMCLLSDAAVMSVWPTMKPYLTAGKALYFSHGFAITWSDRTGVVPPKDIDVIMVAPKGSGTSLRTMFLEGRGLNSSYAIYQDATGKALDRTLALGIGIGSGYLFETTFIREATSDLTGERGSLMGAIQGLLLAQYEVLRENGHTPSEAFNETVEELTQSLMPLFAKNGMDWMYANCSTTAQRGALDWMGPFHDAIKPVVQKLYQSVKSGNEAQISIDSNSKPDYREKLNAELKALRESEMWQTAVTVRKLRPENN